MDSVKVHYIWHLLWVYGYSESFVYLCWVCLPFLFPFYWNKKRCNFLRVGSWLTRLTLQQTEATHWSTKAWLAPLPLLLLSTLSILCNFTFLQSPVREILASFFVHLIHLFNFVFFWKLKIPTSTSISYQINSILLILTLYRISTSVWTISHYWSI